MGSYCSHRSSGGAWSCVVGVRRATEEAAEHVSEALAHGAVDDEVERVGERDAGVDDQRGRGASFVAEQVRSERVLDDDEQQQRAQRHFDH